MFEYDTGFDRSPPLAVVVPENAGEIARCVRAARDAVVRGGNWGSVGVYLLLLVGVTLATASFATWTFRSYQRTL